MRVDSAHTATTQTNALARCALPQHGTNAVENEVLRLMEERGIRRVLLMQDHRLTGMISEADIATQLTEHRVIEVVERLYAAPMS